MAARPKPPKHLFPGKLRNLRYSLKPPGLPSTSRQAFTCSAYPSQVVSHGGVGIGGAIFVNYGLCKLEDEGVLRIKGNIHLASQGEIPLRIVLIHAVNVGFAS